MNNNYYNDREAFLAELSEKLEAEGQHIFYPRIIKLVDKSMNNGYSGMSSDCATSNEGGFVISVYGGKHVTITETKTLFMA